MFHPTETAATRLVRVGRKSTHLGNTLTIGSFDSQPLLMRRCPVFGQRWIVHAGQRAHEEQRENRKSTDKNHGGYLLDVSSWLWGEEVDIYWPSSRDGDYPKHKNHHRSSAHACKRGRENLLEASHGSTCERNHLGPEFREPGHQSRPP